MLYESPVTPQPVDAMRRRLLRVVPSQEAAPAGPASRARRLLPLTDVAVAIVMAAVFLQDATQTIVFAMVVVPAVGGLEGYSGTRRCVGQHFRSALRLGVAGVMCAWPVTALAMQSQQPLSAHRMYAVLATTLAGWCVVRAIVTRREQKRPERVVVLGSGQVAARMLDLVERHSGGRLRIVGYLDDAPSVAPLDTRHLGPQDELKAMIAGRTVDRIMVAFSSHPDTRMLEVLRSCDEFGVRVDVVPRLFELLGPDVRSYSLGAMPVLTVNERGGRLAQKAGKRVLDVVVSAVVLTCAVPLILLTALLIRLEDRGPVLYRQTRIGYRGRRFSILKFRSMAVDAEQMDAATRVEVATGHLTVADAVQAIKARSDARVTRIGAFLRKTSIDELPQLWNVIRGDMSIVGPRPLREFEVDSLRSWEQMRQLERPGITGLWQVNGRSEVDWHERMQLDYAYVRHWTLASDLEILAKTVPAVIKGDGAR